MVVVFCGLAGSVGAATRTWNNSSTDANLPGSWTGGAPGAGDIALFNTAVVNNPNLTGSGSILGLQFDSGAGAYTFTASGGVRTLTLGSSGVVSGDDSIQTFDHANLALALGANAAFTSNSTGALSFGANLNQFSLSTFTLTLGGTSTNAANAIGASISGSGGITKSGAGNWLLAGANTYTGSTLVSAGVLTVASDTALGTGAAGTTVSSGAALQMQSNITVSSESLSLAGSGISNGGALRNVSGDNQWDGAIATTAAARINSDAGTLTLGPSDRSGTITIGANTLTVGGSGDIVFKSAVGASGNSGGFTKDGTGTVTFNSMTNGYTGTTTVNEGTLILDTANSLADQTIRGNLVIGDGSGSAVVRYGTGNANDKIANTSVVTINADGTLDLNDHDDTIGSFNLTGGTVTTGSGVLTLNGNVTTNANAAAATFSGVLSLGSATRTFTVANGAAASDLTISSTINNGSIIKAGAGTLTITGDNSIGYGGTTTVNAGVLNIQHSLALGQAGANDAAKGTTVASGAALEVEGGIAVGTEALTLSGTGISNGGALRNVSGDNSWAGALSLAAATRINSAADTLTLSGTITGTNRNLTVGGAGNITVSGAIGTGSGTLTKDGAGTLVLGGNNTYSGTTTVSAGVVNIQHGSALGSTGAGTSVVTGAALQLQGGIAVGNEALSLTGTGISADGALRNISGSNSWAGAVTLAGTTRINSDAGTMTLGGGITGTNRNLAIGGAGDTVVNTGITTGSGSLTKDGAGTLTLGGISTYTGATNINAGTLRLGASNAIGNSTAVLVASGATLDMNGRSDTIVSLSGSGDVQMGGGALTVNGTTNTTFSGTMGGGGTFTKSGTNTLTINSDLGFDGTLGLTAGTLQFDVDNAFTGTVNISGGTMLLGNHVDLDIGNLNISGGTIRFAGDATLTVQNLTISGNTTIDFGGTANVLDVLNNLNITAGGTGVILTILNWANATDYFFAETWTGAVFDTNGSAPMNRIAFDTNGSGGTTYPGSATKWLSYDNQITPVPEPSTYGAMLMGAGLAFFALRRWRRSRAARA